MKESSEKATCATRLNAAVALAVLFLLPLAGCPRKVRMDDPRIGPMLEAASAFDRAAYGFSPIPADADVRLERSRGKSYDAMLHFYGKTSRTIAFRKTEAGYRWIGEQEIFQGPREYETDDGRFHEEISLTCEIEHVSGYPTNKLNILYVGDDPRLLGGSGSTWRDDLTLEEVTPILREWGY
jgi:hypothetical protein